MKRVTALRQPAYKLHSCCRVVRSKDTKPNSAVSIQLKKWSK